MPRYVPEAVDTVWLNFTPQAEHEQADHRPALVRPRTRFDADHVQSGRLLILAAKRELSIQSKPV